MDRVEDPEHLMLQTALDHAWAWYAMRFNQYLQLLNSALLATAIFSAAYVAALSSRLGGVAAGVALAGSAGSLVTAYTGRLIQHRADLAQRALTEIQDRLADQTQIASLRMFATAAAASGPRLRTRQITDIVMLGAAVAWLAAAVYPIAV
jgi:hypothetical protein